jgi:hypothetical protein
MNINLFWKNMDTLVGHGFYLFYRPYLKCSKFIKPSNMHCNIHNVSYKVVINATNKYC